ncbi:ribose 1,5-bisphosphate phosphokinase PhnN [Jannaschia pagri]|uniref:Ribose 1,5-bisphosphate phosphokinase PhnN n=1 Tax=Jannaschia pagri TaxID=2829797 RepID=A0ABQ4NJ95_9RHOB|nr:MULTISPECIES: phosphonate metabolism protein/1,5-bisphosphokinase (PRPP-forming) PhnN [unclassified Jannaschia]GIT90659.1 ribose 1,5-bisphosphate phosphokinase PhnN [Jannaschia sp. AI_61]GIT94491.1 ribose 1,5-bisphosphate phosphokinase PhnN [Jannaschia sp. AI_62]
MTGARVIAVVGPSGVGKDSVMAGVARALPDLHLVRRVITRASGLGGEAYDAVPTDTFLARANDGAFAVHWAAHGLHYGIPRSVHDHLTAGTDCLINFSRRALGQGARTFPRFMVLNITASPETLAQRLSARGRETASDIAKRLAQANTPLPLGLDVVHLSNDGPLDETVARAVALLQPARA